MASVQICSHRPGGPGCIKALPLATRSSNKPLALYEKFGEPHIISKAAVEQETMRLRENSNNTNTSSAPTHHHHHQSFPPVCLQLLRSLPGNRNCIDCGHAGNPDWASISHGTLLCLSCAGKHRGLGVQTSKVRSISMDSWSYSDVLTMLEGGNGQLSQFYYRHLLCEELYQGPNSSSVTVMRYKTKAAQFYRENLVIHVSRVAMLGAYQGREKTRQLISERH